MNQKIGPITYSARLLKRFPMAIITFILITVCFVLETAGMPYISKIIADLVASEDRASVLAKLPYLLMASFGINFIIGLLYRFEGFFIDFKMAVEMRRMIQLDVLNVLLGKSYNYHLKNMSGDLITKITDIMDSVPEMIKLATTNVFKVFIGIMLSSIAIWPVHPFFTFVVLLNMFMFLTAYFLCGETIGGYSYAFFQEYSNVTGRITDFLNNFVNFALFSNKKQQSQIFKSDAGRMYDAEINFQRSIFLGASLLWLIYLFTTFLNFGAIMYFIQTNRIKVGDSLLIIGVNCNTVAFLFMAIFNLSRVLEYYGQISQAIDAIYEDGDDFHMDLPHSKAIKIKDGSIEFKDVCFGYSEDVEVLHNISLSIKHGSKVGIVGPSGSGKSTMLKLIKRLCRPKSGSILIDGEDTKTVTQESLIQGVTSLPQETLVFSRSVKDNVCYNGESEENLIKLMKKLGLHDAIMSLPDGYDTMIGSGGHSLSGGQIQRLGAARALIRENARVIVLDEPTSHLDPNTTEAVYKAVVDHVNKKNMTMIMVAHDMNMVVNMDRILVVSSGRIVQDGTHESLMQDKKGTYFELFGK